MDNSILNSNWDLDKLHRTFKTDEAIKEAHDRAENLVFKLVLACGISIVGGILAGLIGWAISYAYPSLQHTPTLDGMAIMSALAVIAGIVLFFVAMSVSGKAELLEPLGSSEYCIEANDLVTRFEAARKVRDEILQCGRQLYVMDYVKIAWAAKYQVPDNEDELQRAACASLHKLTSDV